MSLSLVKLSDNGFIVSYQNLGFWFFSLWGGTREFVFLNQPGETEKLYPAVVYSFILMSCHSEGFLVVSYTAV